MLRFSPVLGFALLLSACGTTTTSRPPGGSTDAGTPVDLAQSADLWSPCGQCMAPTPLCDPKAKTCVACLADKDCPQGTICKAGQCVSGCSAGRSECGDAGSCDVDMGRCRGCLSDAECGDPAKPVCDVPSGRCMPCT